MDSHNVFAFIWKSFPACRSYTRTLEDEGPMAPLKGSYCPGPTSIGGHSLWATAYVKGLKPVPPSHSSP